MEDKILTESFQIRPSEINTDHYIKLGSLADMMQTVAWKSAEELGFGYKTLSCEGLGWMLSRLYFSINVSPRWGQKIKIQTWPKGIEKLFALRDFLVFGDQSNDQPLIKATSAWLLMDLKTKRPHKIQRLEKPMPSSTTHAVETTPEKITPPSRKSHSYSVTVGRTHLDANFHTNNANYIFWVENVLPIDWCSKHQIHTFQINFLAESFVGDLLTIECDLKEDCYGRIFNQNNKDIAHFYLGFSTRSVL